MDDDGTNAVYNLPNKDVNGFFSLSDAVYLVSGDDGNDSTKRLQFEFELGIIELQKSKRAFLLGGLNKEFGWRAGLFLFFCCKLTK